MFDEEEDADDEGDNEETGDEGYNPRCNNHVRFIGLGWSGLTWLAIRHIKVRLVSSWFE